MIKVIVIIRTSTVRQEIEAQRIESVEFAKSFGYLEEEITVIGKQGASAIKVDEAYKQNLNKVYKTIENNPSIECVVAWGLDRIARKPIPFYEFRDFLVAHKVQLRLRNPNLYLLNEDGSINNGMELAISLFLTIAEQEMRTKQERFMRAKKHISKQGKFIGARYMMYGYTTDENGYLIINEEEADVVRLIFNMYANNNVTARSIANELNERGYRINNKKFGEGNILNILKNTAYTGISTVNKLVNKFPVIIDSDLYKAVEKVRKSRNARVDKSITRVNLASGILKCWECGGNYMYVQITNKKKDKKEFKYVCYHRQKKYRLNAENICTNSCTVQQEVLDEILRDLAYSLKASYNYELNETRLKELKERKVILVEKIETADLDLEHMNIKSTKLVDAYLNELLTKKEYEERVDRFKAEQANLISNLEHYKKELEETERLLRSESYEEDIDSVTEKLIKCFIENKTEEDLHEVKKVIDNFIKRAYAKAITCNGTNLTIIMVADFDNNIYNFVFQQKHGKKEGMYSYIDNELKIYPHFFLNIGEEEKGVSKAVQDIMNSREALIDLEAKVKVLNEQMIQKL